MSVRMNMELHILLEFVYSTLIWKLIGSGEDFEKHKPTSINAIPFNNQSVEELLHELNELNV